MRRQRLAHLTLALAALFSPRLATADDRATAQQLFEQGRALLGAGNVAEACPKFEAAAHLSATPGVRLNLADCWAKLGRTASAWGAYDEALVIAQRTGDAAAADAARKARAALEPDLSYVTVTVAGPSDVPGLEVSRDGQKLPRVTWGTPVAVDPGEHVIEAVAPSRQRWSTRRVVTRGGDREGVSVPILAPDAPPPSPVAAIVRSAPEPASSPATEASTGGGGGSTQRALAWVTGGIGLAGILVGTGAGIGADVKKNDYQGPFGKAGGACPDQKCADDSVQANNLGNISTVAFIAGGVLVATGAVLWVTAPARPGGLSARLTAVGGPRSAGAAVMGSW